MNPELTILTAVKETAIRYCINLIKDQSFATWGKSMCV